MESKKGITLEGLNSEIESLANGKSEILEGLLKVKEIVKRNKEKDITFSEPILTQNGNPIIFPNTINYIQGQAGVHKSRFAEYICAALLKQENCKDSLLGIEMVCPDNEYKVVYVDTERNLSEQFPAALQSLQVRAGFNKTEHPENLEYLSLLKVDRRDRFKALDEYLKHIRNSTKLPLFIVLDVSTDCISDFNKTDESLKLIDLMNIAINEHNVVFLCIIHENPNSEKARGHFGTELNNKSSTGIQVGFEKDAKNKDTNLIKVTYRKCRSTARYKPFYAIYCEDIKGLVLAEEDEIQSVMNDRQKKADNNLVCEWLSIFLGDETKHQRRQLLDKFTKQLKVSEKTIESRLKAIIEQKTLIKNQNQEDCHLIKIRENRETIYLLEKLNH